MKNTIKIRNNELRAAEVQLRYKTKVSPSARANILNSRDAFNLFWQHWDKNTLEHCEEFRILLLNHINSVLGIASISKGGIAGTVIDTRIIFQYALKAHASSIIICHNHPSGNHIPSSADIEITRKLAEAGKILDIKVLDHIFLCADGSYISLADEGRI